nr:serine/threonine-protein phosphatase 6 regulatory ankyrin repeat subunit C isoform X1 [Oryza sativa Japonica Group]
MRRVVFFHVLFVVTQGVGVAVGGEAREEERRRQCYYYRCAGALLRAAVLGDLHHLARMAAEVDAAAPGGGEGAGGVRSRCGRGALHLAAANGRTHVCRFLLEGLGLPVDALSASGETPLLLAATFGHTSTAAYLLDRGADPSTPDPNGGDTPLHWAAYNGDRELAKLLLLRGADVGAANPRGTALHVAAARGHAAVVSVLLNHGADPNKIANIVFTPLVSSLLGGSLECMKLLIQAGANVNGAGFNGATPLLLACSRTGSIGFIKCLVESGADPNIPDELDRLPIEIAAIHAEREVIEVLLPLTHQVPTLLDWSVGGIIRYVKYPAYKEWFSEQARNASCKRKDELKLQGNSSFNNEDYDAAILLYSMAMKFDNTDAKLYSNRSACWLNLGIGDEALSDAQICSKMQPDWAKGYYRQGMAFSLLQDYASASYVLRRALKLDPQNATVAKALRDVLETACPRMEESGLAFVHQKKRDWSPAAAGSELNQILNHT